LSDAPFDPNAFLSSVELVLRFKKDGLLKLPNMPGRDLMVGDESVRDPELVPVRTESGGRPDCKAEGVGGAGGGPLSVWVVRQTGSTLMGSERADARSTLSARESLLGRGRICSTASPGAVSVDCCRYNRQPRSGLPSTSPWENLLLLEFGRGGAWHIRGMGILRDF
jgi:hypothetical protein